LRKDSEPNQDMNGGAAVKHCGMTNKSVYKWGQNGSA